MIYYVTNLDRYKNLWDYLHIEKCNVNYVMYNDDIIRADKTDKYEYFDKDDIMKSYALLKIDSLEELHNLMKSWKQSVIIEKPYDFENIDYMKLVIYDSWNE